MARNESRPKTAFLGNATAKELYDFPLNLTWLTQSAVDIDADTVYAEVHLATALIFDLTHYVLPSQNDSFSFSDMGNSYLQPKSVILGLENPWLVLGIVEIDWNASKPQITYSNICAMDICLKPHEANVSENRQVLEHVGSIFGTKQVHNVTVGTNETYETICWEPLGVSEPTYDSRYPTLVRNGYEDVGTQCIYDKTSHAFCSCGDSEPGYFMTGGTSKIPRALSGRYGSYHGVLLHMSNSNADLKPEMAEYDAARS